MRMIHGSANTARPAATECGATGSSRLGRGAGASVPPAEEHDDQSG